VPRLLRSIRKSKWYKHREVPWLPTGKVQADALGDLKTEDNKLSVWHVEDDRSNLERVVAAFAASRECISNFDYALVDEATLLKLNVKMETTPGLTPDDEVNGRWHRDLCEMTADKLLALAMAIAAKGERKRLGEKEVRGLIRQAIEKKRIDQTRLKPRVAVKI